MIPVSVSNVRGIFTAFTGEDVKRTVGKVVCGNILRFISKISNIQLHQWPFLMSLWFIITLIITYSVSVGKKHTYKAFPYISDTGTYPPESCIFSQLINIGSVMMLFNLYLRYRQIEMLLNQIQNESCSKLNRLSMGFAVIGSLGMSIVANFQKMNSRGIHFIGADMVLGGGVLYTILQTKISYEFRMLAKKSNKYGLSNKTIYIRIIISSMCFVLFFVIVGCGYASEKNYQGDLIWWTPQDKGYVLHVIATISEWLIIVLMLMYIMTYTGELKALEFIGIQFKFLE